MKCQRCGVETSVTIMSMFNEQIICMDCKDKEVEHPLYKGAREAEVEQVRQGNYNFKGVGKPSNL